MKEAMRKYPRACAHSVRYWGKTSLRLAPILLIETKACTPGVEGMSKPSALSGAGIAERGQDKPVRKRKGMEVKTQMIIAFSRWRVTKLQKKEKKTEAKSRGRRRSQYVSGSVSWGRPKSHGAMTNTKSEDTI